MSDTKKKDFVDEGQQLIVEEKITKAGGETAIRKYIKGRFLGKVHSGDNRG